MSYQISKLPVKGVLDATDKVHIVDESKVNSTISVEKIRLSDISYDNSLTGLPTNNAQAAIDYLAANGAPFMGTSSLYYTQVTQDGEIFTVGIGGDYLNLQDALVDNALKRPLSQGNLRDTIVLRILDGYKWTDEILLEGLDLSHITLVMNPNESLKLSTGFGEYMMRAISGSICPVFGSMIIDTAVSSNVFFLSESNLLVKEASSLNFRGTFSSIVKAEKRSKVIVNFRADDVYHCMEIDASDVVATCTFTAIYSGITADNKSRLHIDSLDHVNNGIYSPSHLIKLDNNSRCSLQGTLTAKNFSSIFLLDNGSSLSVSKDAPGDVLYLSGGNPAVGVKRSSRVSFDCDILADLFVELFRLEYSSRVSVTADLTLNRTVGIGQRPFVLVNDSRIFVDNILSTATISQFPAIAMGNESYFSSNNTIPPNLVSVYNGWSVDGIISDT